MKSSWLYLGLCAYGLCLCPRFALPCYLILSAVFLFRHQGKWCLFSLGILGFLWWRLMPTPTSSIVNPVSFTVAEVRSSYLVAKSDQGRILVNDVPDAMPDERIVAQMRCDAVSANRNFGAFDFVAYWQRRFVTQRCDAVKIIQREQRVTLRSLWWQRIQSQNDAVRDWLNQTLCHLRSDEEMVSFITADGMHIALLLRLLTKLLQLWLPKRRCQTITLGLSGLMAYFTGFRDSLVRIFCFRLIPWLFPDASAQDILGLSVLLVLGLRPYLAQELSLALPFAFRFITLFSRQKLPRLGMSMAVLIPLQFYFFHTVDFASILLMFPMRLLLMINFGLAWLYVLFPLSLWYELAGFILRQAAVLDGWHGCVYYQAPLWFVLFWYGMLLAYMRRKDARYAWRLAWLFCFTQMEPYLRPYAEVVMLDVGQGDCTLISLPFHQGNILIDAAGSKYRDVAADIIIPALQARGVIALDLVIITHEDVDHSGSLEQLQEAIPIKQVLRSKEQAAVKFHSFTLQFLLTDHEFADRNEDSIITYVQLFQEKFLFMGDSGAEAEKALLNTYPNLRADVLKVGHHGSKSASTPAFIHQVHPYLALISCGAHNLYGHPSPITLTTLTQEHAHILDTPHHGAIMMKITNLGAIYKTAAHEFGIINNGD